MVEREIVSLQDLDELRQQMTRGPPASQFVLADVRAEKIGRETVNLQMRAPEVFSPTHPVPEGFAPNSERVERIEREHVALNKSIDKPWGLPLFHITNTRQTYNFPRLIERKSPRVKQVAEIEGRANSQIEVADSLTLISETGDIAVQFGAPEIDQKRITFYYPPASASEDIIGYYPKTRTLEFADQSRIKFDEDGFPVEVALYDADPGMPTVFAFSYSPKPQDKGPWPEPISCSVTSAGKRAVSGTYRLVKPIPKRAR